MAGSSHTSTVGRNLGVDPINCSAVQLPPLQLIKHSHKAPYGENLFDNINVRVLCPHHL